MQQKVCQSLLLMKFHGTFSKFSEKRCKKNFTTTPQNYWSTRQIFLYGWRRCRKIRLMLSFQNPLSTPRSAISTTVRQGRRSCSRGTGRSRWTAAPSRRSTRPALLTTRCVTSETTHKHSNQVNKTKPRDFSNHGNICARYWWGLIHTGRDARSEAK